MTSDSERDLTDPRIYNADSLVTFRDPLNRALSDWRAQMRSDSYAPATIRLRIGVVTRLCQDQNVPDGHMSEAQIRDWLDDGDYMPNSVIAYLRALRKWAKFFGIEDPTERIRRPRTPEFIPRPVTEPQLNELLTGCSNPRMAAWIKLGAYAGLRASEVANLRASQFFDHGTSVTLYVQGKGDKLAALPIAQHVADAVRPFVKGGDHRLWDITPAYVSHQFRLYCRTRGYELGFHQNRHRFGTILYQQSRDLLMTQRLMRHASPKQTTAYVLISDETHSFVEALPMHGTPPGAASPVPISVSYR